MRKLCLSVCFAGLTIPNVFAVNSLDHEQIMHVIDAYYDGMTRGDPKVLDDVLHDKWHLKTLGGPADDPLLVGGKREYIKMYTGKKQPKYPDDRHITSIDIANNSLAIVRIDSPSRKHTVFFTLVKIGGLWSMTSKAFIAEKEANQYSVARD
ncbi:MAG: nuclear transport factor 2 family protein [Pseudomonadales bacterium]